MKKITLLILLFAFKINAQVSSYTFSVHTGGAQVSSGSDLGFNGTSYVSNQNQSYNITLPFTFYYDGNPYQNITACTNGFIRMGTTNSNGLNILNNASATNVISGLNTEFKARALYQAGFGVYVTLGRFGFRTTGTAPNRVFTVYWIDYTNSTTAENNTFDIDFNIKLYETSNVIEFVYGNILPAGSSTVQVGLKGASNSDVNAITTTNNWASVTQSTSSAATCTLSNTVKPANATIFRWTPPAITCDTPSNLAVTNVFDTTATLNWDNDLINSSNNFQYSVQPAGTGEPTVAGTAVTNSRTANITGLSPETAYEIYVRKACTYGKFSTW